MRIIKPLFLLLTGVIFFNTNSYAQTQSVKPGDKAPLFELKSVDGKMISFNSYPSAKGFVVVFMANSCPYSRAYEQRIVELHKQFAPLHYPVVAINSNDPKLSSSDSFIKMKERAKARHYSFPYLSDDQQIVADLYGARSTPQVFIIVKKEDDYVIAYTGAIDNDASNKNPQKTNYASDALNALVNNQKPAIASTRAIGCSITRKKKG